MKLNDFSENFLLLGLRINKHFNGYVDYYYGPPKLQEKVQNEKLISPNQLLEYCYNLANTIDLEDFNKQRRNFFEKTLKAINMFLRILNGEPIKYVDQIRNLYDIEPHIYDDEYYNELSHKADELYKGEGTLHQRIEKYAKQREIPSYKLKKMFNKALNIARKKTYKILPNLLPENEHTEIYLVKNQIWALYNWYKGRFISRIELNQNIPSYWTNLFWSVCHEGYPGHHTEFAIKEDLLYEKKNYFENSIFLLYTPRSVISEGIAEMAAQVLFDPYESYQLLLDKFCPNPKIENSVDELVKQSEIRFGFLNFERKLAYKKYMDGWDNKEIFKYAKNFKIFPEIRIKAMLNFISDRLTAPYAFAYTGKSLIKEKYGQRPSITEFKKLLTEQIVPSEI